MKKSLLMNSAKWVYSSTLAVTAIILFPLFPEAALAAQQGVGTYLTGFINALSDVPSVIEGGLFLGGAAAAGFGVNEIHNHVKDGGRWSEKTGALASTGIGGILMSAGIVMAAMQTTGTAGQNAPSGILSNQTAIH